MGGGGVVYLPKGSCVGGQKKGEGSQAYMLYFGDLSASALSGGVLLVDNSTVCLAMIEITTRGKERVTL